MAQVYVLELKYNLQKRLPLKRASRAGKDRIPSGLDRTFLPDQDEMKRVFDKIDKNGDRKITKNELIRLFLWKSLKENEVDEMLEAAVSDRKGYIDFKDFMELHRRGGGIKAYEIQDAFRICDVDEDGKISADDLQKVLHRLEESCSKEECKRMIEGVDSDGDGLVDMEDFMIMMTKSMTVVSV